MDAELLVSPCPAELRPAALRILDAGLPQDQRAGFAEAVARIGAKDEAAWSGLFAAIGAKTPGGNVAVGGAAWVQVMAGNTAMVWPPPADCANADELLRAAADWCDRQSVSLAQLIVAEQDGYSSPRLEACGFARLAELVYMYAPLAGAPPAEATGGQDGVTFLPSGANHPARFAAVVEQTYEGTQDCPSLDGVRSMADVLAGYRAQGRHHPEHWYLVQTGGADVGVLILAFHPASQNWELVYMGVVPQARGRGVGSRILRFALHEAAKAGGERLVLAVDAVNSPALEVYRKAGLREWERRTVYARMNSA
jgi:ribosomal protein S18 acetylase RimI-like enzyme